MNFIGYFVVKILQATLGKKYRFFSGDFATTPKRLVTIALVSFLTLSIIVLIAYWLGYFSLQV